MKKNKINNKKIITILLLSFFISFLPIQTKNSCAWMTIPGVILKTTFDQLFKKINGIINGAMKQAVCTTLNSQVNAIIGGGSGGQARFIVNWQDYLVNQPANQTQKYMNDYLSQMTSGRDSLSGYASEGFEKTENYTASLKTNVQNIINPPTMLKPTYEGNPSQMFASGNFKKMDTYLSGINNPWAFSAYANSQYDKKLEELKAQATAKSIAYRGYIGVGEKNGEGPTTLPGSTVGDMVANAQDLGNKIVAAASDPGEIITAVVSQVMNKAMQVGFANVQGTIQKETRVQAKVNSGTNNAIQSAGPGARFNKPMGR